MSDDSYTPCRARVCGFFRRLFNAVPRRAGSHSAHAVPSQFRFRFAAIRGSDACRNALFAGARTVQRLPGVSKSRSRPLEKTLGRPAFSAPREVPRPEGSPLGGSWNRPWEADVKRRLRTLGSTGFRHGGLAAFAPPGLGKLRVRARTVNSAVFHNASLNAHIEWRFP